MLKFLNIIKANSEIKDLTEANDELEGMIAQLKDENAILKQQVAAMSNGAHEWSADKEALVKAHEDAIKALQEEHAKKISDLENAVKEATGSAGKQAAEIVASLGVEPETVKVAPETGVTTNGRFKFISRLVKQ